MRSTKRGRTLAALALLTAAAAVLGCEPKIGRRWRAYPEPVLQKALAQLQNGRVTEVDERAMDGRKVYEVVVESARKHMNVLLTEDAELLQTEERLEVYELPPEAFESLDKAYPEGFITEVDLISAGADKRYDIELSLEGGASVSVVLGGGDFALRSVTETVELSAVPEAAAKAARAAAGESRTGRVKRTRRAGEGGETVVYSLDLVRDARRDMMKVYVTEAGKVERTVVQPISPDYLDLGLDKPRE